MTQRFEGKDGKVTALHCVRVDEQDEADRGLASSSLQADLVLLAMGFLGPVQDGMVKDLGAQARPARQRCRQCRRATSRAHDKVFSCGDMRRGQSLVVWAIREGRQCAHAVDKFLMGETTLPR